MNKIETHIPVVFAREQEKEKSAYAGDLQWVGAVIHLLGQWEKEKISSDLASGRD